MLTKLLLRIGTYEYETSPDELKNWADIRCAYKRSDFGGIVRTFTTKFDFVNRAYDLLMAEFDAKGYLATASVRMLAMNEQWEYDQIFACDLDFSSMTYTDTTMSIGAIDNGVAAKIKANKSTKYDLSIGDKVTPLDLPYLYDRMEITESATYAVTEGESQDDGSIRGTYKAEHNNRIMLGYTTKEIGVGGAFLLNDDQEWENGCIMEARTTKRVTLNYTILADRRVGAAPLVLMRNNTEVTSLSTHTFANPRFGGNYNFASEDEVMQAIHEALLDQDWTNEDWSGKWCVINDRVYVVVNRDGNAWEDTGKTVLEYAAVPFSGKLDFDVAEGDKVWIKYAPHTTNDYNFGYIKTEFTFSWLNRGKATAITAVRPAALLEALLHVMGAGIDCDISSYDPRLANCVLLAAESIRGFDGAKFTASFSDFTSWMETVFGYIYEIDEDNGMLHFLHRSEVFDAMTAPYLLGSVRNVQYQSDTSVLFSSVMAGYSKQDYSSANGRLEFNQGATYTTGYKVAEKKLELKSPFRADGYGIELLCQKRGAKTSDSSSDKAVFFVTAGTAVDGYYPTFRPTSGLGAIVCPDNPTLINGEYSPLYCLSANKEYISAMATSMELTFASADGNVNLTLGGMRIDDTVTIEDAELFTAGTLKFTTATEVAPTLLHGLVAVTDGRYAYEGFVTDVTFSFARPKAVEYTIMIHKKTCI